MKAFILLVSVLFAGAAHAQFSVQETDGSTRLKVLGKTWNTNFFSLASTETDHLSDGGRISTYNYVTFATYIKNSFRMGLRVPFQYNTAGTDRFNGGKGNKQELMLQDIIVSIQKYDLAYLPWDLGLYWEGRAYAPTSKFSRDTGMITRVRNQFILSKVFNRYMELEYDNKYSYYLQSRTTYSTSFEDEEGFPVENVAASTKQQVLEQRLQLWGKVTPQFGVGWQLGANDETWNASAENNKNKPVLREWITGPSVRFPLNDNVNFIFVYEDRVDREDADELGKFYADNTQFTLLSFVRF